MRYVGPERQGSLLPEVSLADLAAIVYRRRWGIILIVLVSVASTMGYVMLIRGDTYVAEARLLVRLGQEQAPAPTTIADRQMMVAGQVGLGSGEMELLRSRDLITRLVDTVDLTARPRPPPTSLFGRVKEQAREAWVALREQIDEMLVRIGLKPRLTPRELAIETVARALIVESPPNSNLVIARVIWPQRGVPGPLLQTLLDLYFAHRSTIYQGATAATFFRERRQETGLRLASAEEALARFERANGISSPDEQRNTLIRRLSEAETGVDSARVELDQAEAAARQFAEARESGEQELAMFAVSSFGTALQQTLAGQLATAAARWLSAQTTLGPQDQNMRRLRSEIGAISGMLQQQIQAKVTERREALALRETLRDDIATELRRLQDALVQWHELRRAVSSSARAYEFNDNKLNEAMGIAALEQARIGNVVIAQQPAEQALPLGVRKSAMLLLAVVGGFVLAGIWVTTSEFFDHRLRDLRGVEDHLHLRPLGLVPLDARAFAKDGPPRRDTENALARIAATLGRTMSPDGGQAIVMTGGAVGEGVTTVTAHLGHHLVRLLGLRVLLIAMADTPPALAEVAARLPTPPARLAAEHPLSRPAPGWAIIPLTAGETMPHRLEPLLRDARAAFDVILIDAPPATESAATLLLARAAGQVLLVCSADRLPHDALRRLCNELTAEQIEVTGCVLNRYRRPLPAWLEKALR
jgi:uncharacterized protein involved in exopolysaccharide biosynthesis